MIPAPQPIPTPGRGPEVIPYLVELLDSGELLDVLATNRIPTCSRLELLERALKIQLVVSEALARELGTDLRTALLQRHEVGLLRYGLPLQPFNGRQAMWDALEEGLDQSAYLTQALLEGAKR